jgi:hypothetical protein
MNPRATAKHLGLGRLAYVFWHAPAGAVHRSITAGGPIEQWRDRRAHTEMIAAASRLPPQNLPSAVFGPEIHFLTGARFWEQTAFCLRSLQQHAGRALPVVFQDDGTTTDAIAAHLARLFPDARWRRREEIVATLDRHLPAARFPVLRERWAAYPNIRKLTDVHLGSRGWKLVLDSDLLFFRRPTLLLDWLAAPSRPLHAVDSEENYGYSRRLMEQLASAPIPSFVNVGLCGLQSETLDWTQIEAWSAELIAREKTSYYLEQALVAMLLAGQECTIAPAADYVTLPSERETLAPRAVMHHYVAGSKRWYFRHTWRRFLSDNAVAPRP